MKTNDHMRFETDIEDTLPSSSARAGLARPATAPAGRPWVLTLSGRAWYPDAPEDYAYDIREIATCLSREPRFVGHTHAHLEAYNVAHHSVLVVRALVRRWGNMASLLLRRATLLHDSAEAFWKDMPAPIKRLPALAGYREGIARTERAISTYFGVDLESLDARIKVADLQLLATEKRDLLAPSSDESWGIDLPSPLPERITPWSAEVAKENFVAEWMRLGGDL